MLNLTFGKQLGTFRKNRAILGSHRAPARVRDERADFPGGRKELEVRDDRARAPGDRREGLTRDDRAVRSIATRDLSSFRFLTRLVILASRGVPARSQRWVQILK